jgi:hypothetical protein
LVPATTGTPSGDHRLCYRDTKSREKTACRNDPLDRSVSGLRAFPIVISLKSRTPEALASRGGSRHEAVRRRGTFDERKPSV